MTEPSAPRFRREPDGSVTAVDGFPQEIMITAELLRDADPSLLHMPAFRQVFLACGGELGRYRLVRRHDRFPHVFIARRLA